MELTGTDAPRHRDRRRPQRHRPAATRRSSASTAPPARPRWASTCATCRSTAACRSRACPTPGCRRWSTARCTTTSPPSSSPSTTAASSRELGVTVIGGCCGTTPELHEGGRRGVRRPRARAPQPGARGRRHVDLQLHAVRAGRHLPDHRRAHQRQRLQEVPRRDAGRRLGHLRADGAGAGEGRRPRPRRVRRLRRPRRHRRHGRDRVPLRHPGHRAARPRLHRAAGDGSRPPVDRRPRHPQLRQPRRRRGAWVTLRPRVHARRRVRRGRHLPPDRRGGPGPRRRVEDAGRPSHPRAGDDPLRTRLRRLDLRRADLPALHGRRRPPPRRHRHDRGHPPHQVGAAGRPTRCSASRTCRSA